MTSRTEEMQRRTHAAPVTDREELTMQNQVHPGGISEAGVFRPPLHEQIEALAPWSQNLHLADGLQTAPNHPLGDFPRNRWREIAPHLPKNLRGWRALDIGCNAGYYSFELARRGADVLAIDADAHCLRQARWAAKQYKLHEHVHFEQMQVYELADMPDQFDLVMFTHTFNSLRYALLGLDLAVEKMKQFLVFQSLLGPGDALGEVPRDLGLHERERLRDPEWPTMAFIEHRLAGDPATWWIPNRACVEAMLRSAGLRISAGAGDETYICQPSPFGDYQRVREECLAATGRACD